MPARPDDICQSKTLIVCPWARLHSGWCLAPRIGGGRTPRRCVEWTGWPLRRGLVLRVGWGDSIRNCVSGGWHDILASSGAVGLNGRALRVSHSVCSDTADDRRNCDCNSNPAPIAVALRRALVLARIILADCHNSYLSRNTYSYTCSNRLSSLHGGNQSASRSAKLFGERSEFTA
jgi:hypothetical protein